MWENMGERGKTREIHFRSRSFQSPAGPGERYRRQIVRALGADVGDLLRAEAT